MPSTPDANKGDYNWIKRIESKIDGKKLGTTSCYEMYFPHPKDDEKSDYGYKNPIHMRRRSCFCDNCFLHRNPLACNYSKTVGKYGHSWHMWKDAVRNDRAWVKQAMKEVNMQVRKVRPSFKDS